MLSLFSGQKRLFKALVAWGRCKPLTSVRGGLRLLLIGRHIFD